MKPDIQTPLQRLYADPHRFDFFQAVRLIYRAHDFGARSTPTDPGPLRFSVPASLSFPASEIDDLQQPSGAGEADGADTSSTMRVNFMGLSGPSGVLPRHYTEWMIERRQNRDPVMQDFFDLFNTRLIQLFWRAWAKYRADIGLEFGHANSVLRYVFHLVGMGTPSLYEQAFPKRAPRSDDGAGAALPTRALGYYSGLISQRPHGIGSVSQVLGDFIGAPVAVDGCFGTWQSIPNADRSRLGHASAALGSACVLGARYWDRQTTLRLRVGPLSAARYQALMPGGTLLAQAAELTRFMTGIAVDLHFKLQLRAADWQPLRLGRGAERAAQLGWNTWLSGDRRGRAADDCEFHLSALASASRTAT